MADLSEADVYMASLKEITGTPEIRNIEAALEDFDDDEALEHIALLRDRYHLTH